MNKNFQLVIVGVGGQGILTVSDILGTAAIEENLNAVMSEVHGMAQRGGVVVTEMKIGGFYSPLVPSGQADVILGFEPLEAYRALNKASSSTVVVTNSQPIIPPNVSLGEASYPPVDDLFSAMRKQGLSLIAVPALELAAEAGSSLAGNVVMLGALTAVPGFVLSRGAMEKALEQKIRPALLDVNREAFRLGYEEALKQI